MCINIEKLYKKVQIKIDTQFQKIYLVHLKKSNQITNR